MRNTKKPVEKHSLHVKTGDRVVLTSGKDKGKIGNVKAIIASENKVVVEGANIITKAQKPNPMAGIQGGLIKIEAPVDSSKVMVVCPKCEKATRVKHDIVDGKKVRVCKKCAEQLDV
jgi:large subunit ribosomal protein L24